MRLLLRGVRSAVRDQSCPLRGAFRLNSGSVHEDFKFSIHMPVYQRWRVNTLTHSRVSVGQVTFTTQRHFLTGKRNQLLLIRYLFFTVTVQLKLRITTILNSTKSLLVTTKSNQLCSGTVIPLHFISVKHRSVKVQRCYLGR